MAEHTEDRHVEYNRNTYWFNAETDEDARAYKAGWADAHALRCDDVPVVRGWRTHPDGSRSPVERWVKHADGDWLSLDSGNRTSGDIFMEVD